jgi:hypothetical protein
MDSADSFRKRVLKDYYEWFNRNAKELKELSIQDRINKFLDYERIGKK